MKDEIIDKLLDYLKVTEDFLIEQTPEVIQQALRYETISAILGVGLCTPVMIVSIVLCWYWVHNPQLDRYDCWTGLSTAKVFITGFVIMPTSATWIVELHKLIKILVAPKYYLIQLILGMKGK